VRFALLASFVLACTEPVEPRPAAVEREAPSIEAPIEPPAAPAERVVRLSAAGDLVLNPDAMAALRGEGAYTRLLAGYAQRVDDDELSVLNLEQPLVNDLVPLDSGWPRQDPSQPRRSPILGATPALAGVLRDAHVDLAALSNNHAYDQGRAGLSRTVEALEQSGVRAAGAGANTDAAYAPVVLEQNGLRVAFVSYAEFFNQRPSGEGAIAAVLTQDELVARSLAAARERADIVVALVHWNRDFEPAPRSFERRMARALVDRGADVVLGTGPHVLHPVERLESPRGEALVAYSLGNVASGMGRVYRLGQAPNGRAHPATYRPEAREGLVLRLTIAIDDGAITFRSVTAVPLWTLNNWLEHEESGVPYELRVVPMHEAPDEIRGDRLPRIGQALGPLVTLETM
jgi:hypothetical protein